MHELHTYLTAVWVPGHTQHRKKKMEKGLERPLGYRTHQVLNDTATSIGLWPMRGRPKPSWALTVKRVLTAST